MQILIAPDSFKGSLTAREVAEAMKLGVKAHLPNAQTHCIPFSDGGEGALDFLTQHFPGQLHQVATQNALGHPIEAPFYRQNSKAWIELSQAAGLTQIPAAKRNPLKTSTYGVGLLIKAALEQGCREVYLGIGGSATHDLGMGIFCALGGLALDTKGVAFVPTGGTLGKVDRLDLSQLHPATADWTLRVVCDVPNPLLGATGAAQVFAPQKGAHSVQQKTLETNTLQLSKKLQKRTSHPLASLEGGGSAGGTAAGMHALFGASLQSGFETFYHWADLDTHFQKATLLITGEGTLDAQSLDGKVPLSLAQKAQTYGVPTLAVCGQLKLDFNTLKIAGISGCESLLATTGSLQEAQKNAFIEVQKATQKLLANYLKANP